MKGIVEIKICNSLYRTLVASLKTEISQPQPGKGKVIMNDEGGCLVLKIVSNNISGLRALTNSFLYLLHAAFSTLETTKDLAGDTVMD